MGYVHNRRQYRLIFDGDLTGLEVTVRSASALVYKRIAELASRTYSSPASEDDIEAATGLYKAFAGVLVSWNLEEPEGVPVPATLDAIESQELNFVMALVIAWMDAVASALGGKPTDELLAELEASLPMEPLSA